MDFYHFNAQTSIWSPLSGGPSGRKYHSLEWDQGRNRLILFGGTIGSAYLNDLWTYSIERDQWQPVNPVGTSEPPERYLHACAINTQSLTFHVQGGLGFQSHQDLWQFNFTSNIWTLLNAGDSNVLRSRHSMQYSTSLNSLLVFFGDNQLPDSFPDTIYQFSFNNPSAGWTLFQVSGSQLPSARESFSTGFDPQTGEYFVFGGKIGATFLSTYNSSINCRSCTSKMFDL
jgi:hypothetical protein